MRRWLIALPLSVLSVLGLFSVMAALVSPVRPPVSASAPLNVDVLVINEDLAVETRDRLSPPKPEPAPAAPSLAFEMSYQNVVPTSIDAVIPHIALDLSVQAPEIQIPAMSPVVPSNLIDVVGVPSSMHQAAVPLVRVEAEYPPKAIKRRIEGYVIVQFTIDENGRPENVEVIEASPQRVFEREALRAIKRWKYAPKLVQGKAVPQPGQTVKLEFNLAK